MGLLEHLARGTYGVTVSPPPGCVVERESDDVANLTNAAAGVGWYLFFFPGMRLDLAPERFDSLRRDVESHANALFDAMRRRGEDGPRSPRSPLVSCDVIAIHGGPALSIIHRMAYQPGKEIVMGHLLVPVRAGLFEARWIVPANQTGFRESVLLLKAMEGAVEGIPEGMPPEEIMKVLVYDDPKFDAMFPQHALSVARSADRWARENVRTADPAPPMTREHALARLGCDLVVPPRFGIDAESKTAARFHRVSLAGNDGVQVLTVERHSGNVDSWSVALARRAETRLAEMGATATSQKALEPRPSLRDVLLVEGELEYDRPRMLAAGFVDPQGDAWLLTLSTTSSQDPAALVEELAGVVETFRPHARRPWWRVWD